MKRQPVGPGGPKPVMIPTSATRGWIVLASVATYVGSLVVMRQSGTANVVQAGMLCLFATAAANFVLDTAWLKVHRRTSAGLDWSRSQASLGRTGLKLIGLAGSIGFVAFLYWLFPEYKGHFYDRFYAAVWLVLPWWMALAVPYFYLVDARQTNPHDGYYHMGLVVALNWRRVDGRVIGQHLLGWLVKGYFLPLMLTYYFNDLTKFMAFDFSTIKDFKTIFDFGYDSVFLVDVGLAAMGYLMAFRLFDTHLRWAEPTVMGWVVALMCYQPFTSMISQNYLDYARVDGWGAWLHESPRLYAAWGSSILVLYGIYLWATVMFGCRFSNLTHRGILTNGPYRWTKHPAYISKNLAWWLTSVPFVVMGDPIDSVRRCGLLLLLNAVYYFRARTEEAHLSQDPTYLQYASWMKQHGLFRWPRR
ncbi:MAG: isoprenylcysteine carboxylmethyltransferase family protein [Acidobacteriota bacterium]